MVSAAGTIACGTAVAAPSDNTKNWSSVTRVVSGAPSSLQFGSSSFSAIGSITAPDRMFAPISDPFSSTQTDTSRPASAARCFTRIAAASPAGPPPTTTTSYSIASRSTCWLSAMTLLVVPCPARIVPEIG